MFKSPSKDCKDFQDDSCLEVVRRKLDFDCSLKGTSAQKALSQGPVSKPEETVEITNHLKLKKH